MAYIGKEPIVGNFQKCDAITVVNGQAAYTLQVSSTNVVPESANHMLVSLNGILQAPTTSFTVSSSTLTFVSNLATGDVIDFVILLGNVLDLGTPSDGTVTTAKIVDSAVTYAKASGFGKVLQVVTANITSQASSNSTSYADAGLSLAITPSASSSKIYVVFNTSGRTDNTAAIGAYTILRGTTVLSTAVGFARIYNTDNIECPVSASILDSPSTTSETTYKIQYKVSDANGNVYISHAGTTSTLTAFEIGA